MKPLALLACAVLGLSLVGAYAPSAPPTPALVVHIKDYKYDPATVTIDAGDSVEWINDDSVAHSATAADKSWDSGDLAQGKSWTHTFARAGIWAYSCDDHSFMKAKLVVK